MQKEAASKNTILLQLEKTLDNIKGDVEASEIRELENKIVAARRKQEEIDARFDEIKSQLVHCYEERHNFEQSVDQIKSWINGKEFEVACPSLFPLKSEAAEKVCQKYQKLDADTKTYVDGTIGSVKRQADSLAKDCDEEDKEELEETIFDIVGKAAEVRKTLASTLKCLVNMVESRKDFEKQSDAAEKWIQEAESSLQTDTRSLNTADILTEHLKKLEKLEDEQEDANHRVTVIANMCEELVEFLTDADKFTLGGIVRNLQDRTEFINNGLPDKIKQIREAIFAQRKMTERMVQSTETLSVIQKEARALTRPVGRKVEDAQNLLSQYQEVGKKVSEFRKSLEEMRKCPDITMEEMRELIKQQQELMTILEKQITRIRQLILIRQQYSSLINEITAFINRYKTIIGDIEKSEMTVADKLKKYNAVIIRMQECEGQLTSAQDKGSIIGEEGYVEDRNAIMEQLQTLRSGLSALRREVEGKQQEHETTAESHKKLQAELNTAMEWLFEQESELKSRPLLTLEVDSAEDEIETHNEIAEDIKEQLNKVEEVVKQAKSEIGIPYILQERISEANMIISTYPLELESRLKYLKDAKALREDYEEFSSKINDWVAEAKTRLKREVLVDYESVLTELDDHNSFFAGEKLIGNILQQLGQTAERIIPSLGYAEQEELSDEIQQLTTDLDEVNKQSKQHKTALEKQIKNFSIYKATLDKCKALIHSASSNLTTGDGAQNIVALRSMLQRIDEERNRLYDQNKVIDNYKELADNLISEAGDSGTKIAQEMVDICKNWKAALENIDARKMKVQQIIEQWQHFDLSTRSLEAGLIALEQRAKELESMSVNISDKDKIEETFEVSTKEFILQMNLK